MNSPTESSMDELTRSLRNLPPYDGILYRAATLSPENIVRYVPGHVVTEQGFVRATPDPSCRFAGNVEFVIYSRSARDVSLYLAPPADPEMVFGHGTSFLVRAVIATSDRDHPYGARIVLEEVDTTRRPFVVIDQMDSGPPELAAQMPLRCELVRVLPGPDGAGEFHIARTATTPIFYPRPDTVDMGLVDGRLVRQAPDGRTAIVLPGLALSARDDGATIAADARDQWVNLHYIIDPAQLSAESVDSSKLYQAAVVRINPMLRTPPAPPVRTTPPPPPPAAEPAFVKVDSGTATTYGRETLVALVRLSRHRLEQAIGHDFDLVSDGAAVALIVTMRTGETIAMVGPADPNAQVFSLQQHDPVDPAATIAAFRELSGVDSADVYATTEWLLPDEWNTPADLPTTVMTRPAPAPAHDVGAPEPATEDNGEPDLRPGSPDEPSVGQLVDDALADEANDVDDVDIEQQHARHLGDILDLPIVEVDDAPLSSHFEQVLARARAGVDSIGHLMTALRDATLVVVAADDDVTRVEWPAEGSAPILSVYTAVRLVPESVRPWSRRAIGGTELIEIIEAEAGATVRFNPEQRLDSEFTAADLSRWWVELEAADIAEAAGDFEQIPPAAIAGDLMSDTAGDFSDQLDSYTEVLRRPGH